MFYDMKSLQQKSDLSYNLKAHYQVPKIQNVDLSFFCISQ